MFGGRFLKSCSKVANVSCIKSPIVLPLYSVELYLKVCLTLAIKAFFLAPSLALTERIHTLLLREALKYSVSALQRSADRR